MRMNIKEEAKRIIDTLPEDTSWEDIMHKIDPIPTLPHIGVVGPFLEEDITLLMAAITAVMATPDITTLSLASYAQK